MIEHDPNEPVTDAQSGFSETADRDGLSEEVWHRAADLVAAIARCYDLSESTRGKLRTALWTWLGWIIDVLQRPSSNRSRGGRD